MSEKDALHGLTCANCGGTVPIPEGQTIVKCPFCNMRSLVRGERGLLRYQVDLQIDRQKAEDMVRRFLIGNQAIARQAAQKSQITEAFVVYLPLWAMWSHVLGWVFGEKEVGSGDDKRYERREVNISSEMSWNGAAAEVAEFGVDFVSIDQAPLVPFDADQLHANGMVFEPLDSISEAESAGKNEFNQRVNETADLDRISQVFIRLLKLRMGLVYYPLWVLRYRFRGRTFQVVVDGRLGKVLYGKAPGNTYYRAAVLIGGMALGSFLVVDISALVVWFAIQQEGDSIFALIVLGLAMVGIGIRIMRQAYRRFRHGEEYEYRQQKPKKGRSWMATADRIWKLLR
jgi:DNA-directed RNA polymerase subunit RPC12/RpoP